MPVAGIPTEVLVAPDSFKGTFSAREVAEAIARGLRTAGRPVALCPLADGGEGTLEAVGGALGLELVRTRVSDPVGRPVEAIYGLGRGVALVEMAQASGLGLVAPEDRDPVKASSSGTGMLVAEAARAGAETILVAVGGSATTDGGAGAVEAIRAGGGLGAARLVVLCDVRTPFEDAARVFAPQKGADPGQVDELTARLHALAATYGRDPRGVAMTGAAGGLAGGLWSEFGAELVSGAAYVLEALGFDGRMRRARAVVTGEGRLDRSSLAGKVVGEVAVRCRQAGVPCHAIVGRLELERFDQRILDLQAVLEATNLDELERAGGRLEPYL